MRAKTWPLDGANYNLKPDKSGSIRLVSFSNSAHVMRRCCNAASRPKMVASVLFTDGSTVAMSARPSTILL